MVFPALWVGVLCFTFGDNSARAGAVPVFESDVRPILKAHCFHCHGEGEELKGGIDVRLKRFLETATTEDHGRVMVPGSAEQSHLLALVRSGDMPKGEKKLKPGEIDIIEAWIAAGAPTVRPEPETLPRGFVITEEEKHFWSFLPIARPEVPAVTGEENPIDAFIQQNLREQAEGLELAPEADRLVLLRRVYLDLSGLPPTPEEAAEFLADDGDNAYERLVDRVLDSPRYGERWGRHWLDVAGYSDSNGYAEADSVRPFAWHYRDYVIRSFNADKPWDQFITEQLAGDELAGVTHESAAKKIMDPTTRELLSATGFLRMAPDGTGDGVDDQNLARNQSIAETLNIVSSSLLGLTVGCAQCHDHRYDPISQADYYRMRAIFEPGFDWKNWRSPAQRLVSLYTDEDRAKAELIEADARKVDEEVNALRKKLLDEVFEIELTRLPENLREAARTARGTPAGERTDEQRALFKEFPAADVQGALDLYDPERNKQVTAKQGEAAAIRAKKPQEPNVMVFTEKAGVLPATFVFNRGDHDEPRGAVDPCELQVLGGNVFAADDPSLASSGRRLAYARWLTNGEHPLVARVLVNRFWMHHFGRGLVSTTGEFGSLGERPSHPELLDWLAREFMASGWRLKPLHRLILTSRVYRQSAQNPDSSRQDPENRLYARWKLKRLEAEVIRDAMLAVSGVLNEEPFGEPVPIAQDGVGRVVAGEQKTDGRGDPTIAVDIGERAFRRSIYVQARRSLPLTIFEAFDSPVMSPNCESRNVSVVPSQPLLMLNDSFVADQARRFATRISVECRGDSSDRIRRAWQLAYQCEPTENELQRASDYLASQIALFEQRAASKSGEKDAQQDPEALALASFCQALFGSNRFLYVE
ncbi:MAG: PSD1 domain-containing protein [Verrucomicrobiae bacterium]|nr:PSD1 domain-containing protein [Verrucomicrobiae bacterium]